MCEVADETRHPREVGALKPAAAERVGAVCVKARGDQHELGTESRGRGDDHVFQQRDPELAVGAGGDGEVDGVPQPGVRPGVTQPAAVGEGVLLVDAREQHVAAAAEDLSGSVTVVHVPVEDEHAPHTELVDRELRGDGDVVEQAEPHRAGSLSVVS